MNDRQRTVLICTAVAITSMALYPPYIAKNYQQAVIKSGYGFVFDLPPYVSSSDSKVVIKSTVDTSTLYVQLAGALIVGGLLYLALGSQPSDRSEQGAKVTDRVTPRSSA